MGEELGRAGAVEREVADLVEQRAEARHRLRRREHAARVEAREEDGDHLALAVGLVHREHDAALDDVQVELRRGELGDAAHRLAQVARAQELLQAQVERVLELGLVAHRHATARSGRSGASARPPHSAIHLRVAVPSPPLSPLGPRGRAPAGGDAPLTSIFWWKS